MTLCCIRHIALVIIRWPYLHIPHLLINNFTKTIGDTITGQVEFRYCHINSWINILMLMYILEIVTPIQTVLKLASLRKLATPLVEERNLSTNLIMGYFMIMSLSVTETLDTGEA